MRRGSPRRPQKRLHGAGYQPAQTARKSSQKTKGHLTATKNRRAARTVRSRVWQAVGRTREAAGAQNQLIWGVSLGTGRASWRSG